VPDITSLEMLLRSLIVALPVLVLIVLFFLLAANRRGRTDAPETSAQASGPQATVREVEQRSSSGCNVPASQPAARHTVDDRPAASGAGLAASQVQATLPAQTGLTSGEIKSRIARAEENGAMVELAELYLALGRALMAEGSESEGLGALRSAAGLAALHKAPKVHALARLDLAEVAISHGDPTTACEHWQMARMAFLDAGARADGDKIDKRMRAQGCPTDWVLTDF
jgi:hypothetical protein